MIADYHGPKTRSRATDLHYTGGYLGMVLCQVARPAMRSSGFGVFNCISCIAGGLVAVGAGALKSTIGLGGALAGTGALLFVSALLLLRLRLSEGATDE